MAEQVDLGQLDQRKMMIIINMELSVAGVHGAGPGTVASWEMMEGKIKEVIL